MATEETAQAQVNIHGWVGDGYEAVRIAFERNFAEHGERGAAFAATVDGEPVVDLWGGLADPASGSPWQEDTLQVIFSGTKGLVALCLLLLVDRDELELEAPVARYWPEFAAHGKGAVRVLELASHRARLPGIRTPLEEDEILDDRRMAALLADQPQETDPRAGDAYHALTFGWLCGELVRRVDGRSIGAFFDDEVARPLGLDVWIGLPPELEGRVATLEYAPSWWDGRRDEAEVANDPLMVCVLRNPPVFPPGPLPWNRPAWHRAEIPSAGGIASARSLARLYGCLARGGELDGVRLLREQTLADGTRELTRRVDPLIDEPHVFGVGFQLQNVAHRLGPPADAFGHGGAGGSMHCAWPSRRVGVSYAMNALRADMPVDPRSHALLQALHGALVD